MALVGDVILRFRKEAADPCQTLLQPVALTLNQAAGGSLTGTIYLVETWTNQWGESLPSVEQSIALTGGNGTISVPTNNAPPGATGGRIYYGTSAAAENQYVAAVLTGNTLLTSITAGTAGIPPIRPRSFLPDSDGGAVSAFEAFDWLNKGLDKLCQVTGGILDENGVAVAAGAAEFVLTGRWLNLTDTWHDGWVVIPDRATFTWMKSTVSGVPGIVSLWKNAAQQVLGIWPQPGTAAAATTLTGSVAVGATVFNVANSVNFRAPGLAIVDSEVFSFAGIAVGGANTQLNLLVRGLGGSVPAAHSNGATVTQLIFRFRGFRMAAIYAVGDSALTVDVPAGWDEILHLYMLSRFHSFEQDFDAAKDYAAQFDVECIRMRNNQVAPTGPRQLGSTAFVGVGDDLAELAGAILVP